jgi:hypothetical protein
VLKLSQADAALAQAKVCEELCLMQRQNMLGGFQFQDYFVIDDQVCSVAAIEKNAVIVQPRIDLPFIGECVLVKFVAQAALIGAFKQTGAEARMHTHRQAYDPLGQAVVVGHVQPRLKMFPLPDRIAAFGLRCVNPYWGHSNQADTEFHRVHTEFQPARSVTDAWLSERSMPCRWRFCALGASATE